MEKVSLTRSNLDQPRAAAILQGIVANNNVRLMLIIVITHLLVLHSTPIFILQVEEINFSHCKLGDSGAHAIGEFLKTHKSLKVLSLMNNGIGANGLAGLVHALLQDTGTPLKHLDLRLNPLRDDGGVHICARKFGIRWMSARVLHSIAQFVASYFYLVVVVLLLRTRTRPFLNNFVLSILTRVQMLINIHTIVKYHLELTDTLNCLMTFAHSPNKKLTSL